MLKRGIDRNDKTRQDSIVWKRAWHFTREEVTRKDKICSGWGGRIFASLLRVGKNLFTVFDLNPGRLSFVDKWILNICVIALSWENLFSVFEVFHLNLRYIIHH